MSEPDEQPQSAEPTLKEKTAKGIFWGGMSNILQQGLNLVFGIVLLRILDADDYGMVGMLAIFTAFVTVILDGGFSAALTNKHNITHADYNAVFWFSTLLGFFMYVVLFFCAPLIANFYNEPELTPLSRFIFLGFIFSGFCVVPSAYLFKNLMVKERAKADIFPLIISGIIGIILALKGYAYWGLAVQQITYVFINACLRWYYSAWKPSLRINFSPLKSMFGFSIKLFFTNLFIQINNNIFPVILGKYYSPADVGYYSQGNKWQTMASSVTSGIIAQVSQPIFVQAEKSSTDPITIFRKLLRFAVFLSFPAMLGLALISKEFILIIGGEKWRPVIPIMQLLCIWGALIPVWRLYSDLLISKGKSNYYLNVNVIVGTFQIILVYLMYPHGIYWMIIVYILLYMIGLLIYHYLASRTIGLRFYQVVKDVLPYLLVTAFVIATTYFITLPINNIYINIIAKILIAVALYSFIMMKTKSVMFKESVEFLRKQMKK